MACDEYKALLPGQAKGSLTADQERLLKDHLRNCDSCRSTLRLLRMDDKAIEGALLGLRPRGAPEAPQSRGVRVVLVGTILVLLVLVALFGVYRGLGKFMEDASGPGRESPAIPATASRESSLEIELEWSGTHLGDALDEVSRVTSQDVVVDPQSLPDLVQSVPGKRPLAGPVDSLLFRILRPLGLAFDLRFGVIFIASPERLAELPVTAPPLPANLAAKSVTLSFAELPLCEALDTLGRLKGIEVVLSARIAGRAAADRVTLDFKGIGLRDALSLILIPRGLTYAESGGLIIVRRQ